MTTDLATRYVAAYRTAIDPMKPFSRIYVAECELRAVTREADEQGITLDVTALEQQARRGMWC